ncbi:hypothetical protein [Priestia aryabhattai]|uniref:hypothetical protein n=1 Tax=Priestia aryabhattai TaxID=412384 RepID=UPI002E1E3737|nr:hypothetical protein [Priestia aryabhattai]
MNIFLVIAAVVKVLLLSTLLSLIPAIGIHYSVLRVFDYNLDLLGLLVFFLTVLSSIFLIKPLLSDD